MASIISTFKVKNGRHDYPISVERYDSAMEVANDLLTRKVTDSAFDKSIDKDKIASKPSWYHVKSYDEAIELLHDGYAPQVTMSEIQSIAKGEGKRIAMKNDIVGFMPVVPLALKGVPNCMVNTTYKPIKCKVVDLYFDATYPCSVEPQDMIENGKKILGAILAIEQSGYRVNLYAVQSYSDSDNADMLAIKIKSSTQPFDLKRMSYPLMHPAFFRVIGFNWYARFPKGTHRFALGSYIANNLNKKDLDSAIKQIFGQNAIYMSGAKILSDKQETIQKVLTNSNTDAE